MAAAPVTPSAAGTVCQGLSRAAERGFVRGWSRPSRGGSLCRGPALPGNTGGTSQRHRRRARGHRQPRPTEPQTGAQPGLWGQHEQGTRGREGHKGHVVGVPRGSWDDARDRGAGGDRDRLAARWQPMAGKGSRMGLVAHGRHGGTGDSGRARSAVATAPSPRGDPRPLRGHTGGTGAALGDSCFWGLKKGCGSKLPAPSQPRVPCGCPGLVVPAAGRGFTHRSAWSGALPHPTRGSCCPPHQTRAMGWVTAHDDRGPPSPQPS